eukprot:11931474-Alexandrium_andersonii.AAC.1
MGDACRRRVVGNGGDGPCLNVAWLRQFGLVPSLFVNARMCHCRCRGPWSRGVPFGAAVV